MFHKDINIAHLGDWWTFVKLRWLKLLMVKRKSDMENGRFSYISAGADIFSISRHIHAEDFLVICQHWKFYLKTQWKYRKCIFFVKKTTVVFYLQIAITLPPYSTDQVSSEKAKETEQQCRVKAEKDAIECRLHLGRVKMPSLLVFGEGCKLVELDLGSGANEVIFDSWFQPTSRVDIVVNVRKGLIWLGKLLLVIVYSDSYNTTKQLRNILTNSWEWQKHSKKIRLFRYSPLAPVKLEHQSSCRGVMAGQG